MDMDNNNQNNVEYNKKMEQQNLEMQRRLNAMAVEKAAKPQAAAWNSMLGADGTIKDNLKLTDATDSRFLDQMRTEGLRQPGEASAMRDIMDQQITRQAGDSQTQLAQAQNQNLDSMAMRGGVSAGARERMMQAGVGQNLANQQNIFGKRLDADMADEKNRLASLQGLGQAEMGMGNMQNNLNLQNRNATTQEMLQKRAYDSNKFNQEMSAWGAEKTAAATPSSGGGKK